MTHDIRTMHIVPLLLAACCALLPALALGQSPAKVTNLTSFHYGGPNETDGSGAPKGWPNIRYPAAPPLYATHPSSGQGFLFGGSDGANFSFMQSVGLWWMPAAPGHYDRLTTSDDKVYGYIPGTPVQSRDGHIYGVIYSRHATSGSALNFSDAGIDCRGDKMADCLAMTGTYPRQDGQDGTGRYFIENHSGLVGHGLMFRTEFDGTNLEIVESTMGQLDTPNGVLVVDGNDNIYGLDQGSAGQGRIFKVDSAGGFHTLYEFAPAPNGEAQVPNGMILGSDGWLYGVTAYPRGIPRHSDTPSALDTPVGSLYRIDPSAPIPINTFQVLHTFTLAEGEINVTASPGTSGNILLAGLNHIVESPDGWLYGTTSLATCFYYGRDYRPIEGIDRWSDRETPLCGSALANEFEADGDFSEYYDSPNPHGAIYRIRKDGSGGLQILHRFSYADGSQPLGPLALGKDGAIYGTTLSGGANRQWVDSTIRGAAYGQLAQEKPPRRSCEYWRSYGTIYPTCRLYETAGELSPRLYEESYAYNGTLYRIVPGNIRAAGDGTVEHSGFESLHSFRYEVDGRRPAGVTAGADGRLYGVTLSGGQGYVTNRNITWYSDDKGTAFMVDLEGDTPDASITLTFTPNEIEAGGTTTVTWTTYQARDCVASWRTDAGGNWQSVEPSGSDDLSPISGSYFHTLQCVDEVKGTQIAATATLYVNAPVTARDGNHTDYGNGGGGGSLPWQLLLLMTPALFARRLKHLHFSKG